MMNTQLRSNVRNLMCGATLSEMWDVLVTAIDTGHHDKAEYVAEYALEVRDDFDDLFSPFDMWGRSESVCWTVYSELERAAARYHSAGDSETAEEYDRVTDAARAQYMRLWREGRVC